MYVCMYEELDLYFSKNYKTVENHGTERFISTGKFLKLVYSNHRTRGTECHRNAEHPHERNRFVIETR